MRLSTAVLALSCVVTGYALVGTRVNALQDASPARRFPSGMGVGTHVKLFFSSDPRLVDCTIARIDGGWIRCAPEEQPTAFTKPAEVWYDLAHVVTVEKVATER
jgi:hypothetical protein